MTSWFKRILAPGATSEAPPTETEDWFTPRTDGIYYGGPDTYRLIKFSAAHEVWITDTEHQSALKNPARAGETVLTGAWTGAGRFSVTRRFQRPIVFVATGGRDDELTLRITDTTTQSTADHTYRFRSRED